MSSRAVTPASAPVGRPPARVGRRILAGALLWTAVLTAAHLWLNVAYIPVTCHLACPVTDYISR